MSSVIDKIEKEQCRQDIPDFKVGDTVKVYNKIVEGTTERIQMFAGVVIARRGSGIREMFTVRRVAFGIGVERVFPLYSPNIKIEVVRHGVVRRAKLYYLRGRLGKAARIAEKNMFNKMVEEAEASAAENVSATE